MKKRIIKFTSIHAKMKKEEIKGGDFFGKP